MNYNLKEIKEKIGWVIISILIEQLELFCQNTEINYDCNQSLKIYNVDI